MENNNVSKLVEESTVALQNFSGQLINVSRAFESMIESGGNLTAGDKADLKDYRRDSHLFKNFLNKHKGNKTVFEKAFMEEKISLQQFDAWTDALNRALLIYAACNVNASGVKQDVEIDSSEVQDYVQVGNIKLTIRSYISRAFEEFKVEEPANEADDEDEKE